MFILQFHCLSRLLDSSARGAIIVVSFTFQNHHSILSEVFQLHSPYSLQSTRVLECLYSGFIVFWLLSSPVRAVITGVLLFKITTLAGGTLLSARSPKACGLSYITEPCLQQLLSIQTLFHYRSFSKGYHLFSWVLTHNGRINGSDWLITSHCVSRAYKARSLFRAENKFSR